MLIAIRAEVESVDHWREKFKTHADLFKSQGVSVAYMLSLIHISEPTRPY